MSRVTEFFDVILKGESKTYNDHNWYTGSGLKGYIQGVNSNPYSLLQKPLSQYTLGEIKSFQSRGRDSQGQLWATGRYQIIPSTLKGVQNRLGLPDSTKYDEQTQDKMGLSLLTERASIKSYLSGAVPDTKENLERASLDVAKIWSSVGVPYDTQGSKQFVAKNQSYYTGGGDRASVKTEDVQEALKKLRVNYDSLFSWKSSGGEKKNRKWLYISLVVLGLAGVGFSIYKIVKLKNK
jgi:hypothetical protein